MELYDLKSDVEICERYITRAQEKVQKAEEDLAEHENKVKDLEADFIKAYEAYVEANPVSVIYYLVL
jgi:molybdopterin converting factor small subunit